jgi:hypothetical protein
VPLLRSAVEIGHFNLHLFNVGGAFIPEMLSFRRLLLLFVGYQTLHGAVVVHEVLVKFRNLGRRPEMEIRWRSPLVLGAECHHVRRTRYHRVVDGGEILERPPRLRKVILNRCRRAQMHRVESTAALVVIGVARLLVQR